LPRAGNPVLHVPKLTITTLVVGTQQVFDIHDAVRGGVVQRVNRLDSAQISYEIEFPHS